ncbi:hypothetical protein [Algoriphagus sediminis]|uniref:GIY-YIG nuclease family protein n=1 Tax=Algoriphagus sediminis TaxID=3057113 RepID=A0ABT7YH14_9BACT|nr:hypothetical protein [Algoriphagus sediminis]MDN3205650.1 hypothetical protein [Algoriphagus sediminis]
MLFEGPYNYTLQLSRNGGNIEKFQEGKKVKFSKSVTLNKLPKIYVILDGKEVLYVGFTSQSVGSRLSGGLKADGKNGYHGYGWKGLEKVELKIFVFEPYSEDEQTKKQQRLFAEAVEAELAFLIRSKTDSWPKYQSEIHFNNVSPKQVRDVAKVIYSHL